MRTITYSFAQRDAKHATPNALCVDCSKNVQPYDDDGTALFSLWDFYLVRGEVWVEAGMDGWNDGHLCLPCLATRLGRQPIKGRDLVAWQIPGKNMVRATDEYLAALNTDKLNDLVIFSGERVVS